MTKKPGSDNPTGLVVSTGKNSMAACILSALMLTGLLMCASAADAQGGSDAVGDLRMRFITFNVNFNNSAAKIRADVEAIAPRADIIMFQEAKWVTIDNFLDTSWTVFQVLDTDAKQGSAIAARNSIIKSSFASGLVLGVDNHGEQMLDRYIAWMDIVLMNDLTVRVMALHMPPARFEYLQPIMADNLANFVGRTSFPVIAGGDWNFTVNNDPWDIEAATGLHPRGVGIDGFYFSQSVVNVVSVNELTGLNVNSDHDPVQMITDTHLPAGQSAIEDWALYQ